MKRTEQRTGARGRQGASRVDGRDGGRSGRRSGDPIDPEADGRNLRREAPGDGGRGDGLNSGPRRDSRIGQDGGQGDGQRDGQDNSQRDSQPNSQGNAQRNAPRDGQPGQPGGGPEPGLLAERVERLGHVAAHADGFSHGLNPAQWSALRYFARANPVSRTVGAFALYHRTTPGTASQTVKALVAKGLLARHPSPADRRSARLDLTAAARRALDEDPFQRLVQAAGRIERGTRPAVAAALDAMLAALESGLGAPTFRRCRECSHLRRCDEPASSHRCALLDEHIPAAELDALCVNFEPA